MDLSNDFYFDDSESMTIDEALDLVVALSEEIPQLLADIAPGGWSKSSYRRTIHNFYKSSDLLSSCKGQLIFRYLIHRKDNPHIPFDYTAYSKECIEGEPFPDATHYEATVLFILCIIVSDLSRHLNLVDSTTRQARLFERYHVSKVLPIALARFDLWPKEKLADIFILDIYSFDIELDAAPFYNAAFRALKRLEYDWIYFHSIFSTFITDLEEYHQIKWSPSAKSDDGMVASEILESMVDALHDMDLGHMDPLDEYGICEAINRKPPNDVVLAYLEVYGELPTKYPLSVNDYKNFYD